jgi:hypothetical protein
VGLRLEQSTTAVDLGFCAAAAPYSKMWVRSGRKLESSKRLNFNVSDERSGMQVPAPERGGDDEAIS